MLVAENDIFSSFFPGTTFVGAFFVVVEIIHIVALLKTKNNNKNRIAGCKAVLALFPRY